MWPVAKEYTKTVLLWFNWINVIVASNEPYELYPYNTKYCSNSK